MSEATQHHGVHAKELISFRIGQQEFCVDIMAVREIRGWTPATPLPQTPSFVRGVINLRGAVVPVIDLAVRFGHPATPIGRRTCVVIVEIVGDAAGDGGTLPLGILVDGVNEVLEVEAAQIEDRPEFGLGLRTDFVRGMIRRRGQFTVILDTDRVLSASELERLVAADAAPPAEAAAA